MKNKILAFFQSTTTKVVASIVFIGSVVTLAIGGITEAELAGGLTAVFKCLEVISGLIALIIGWVSKKNKKD